MALINGAHSIIYSRNADADRALLRDVLGLPNVDVGGGWLIFALPPAEVAVHPADEHEKHELYLMTRRTFGRSSARWRRAASTCSPSLAIRAGACSPQMTLPGGGKIGVYQPRHARPEW